MTHSPKNYSDGSTSKPNGPNDGTSTQTTTFLSDFRNAIEIPQWFLLGGFDRVPRGWKRAARPGLPTRFVELADTPNTRLMVIITGQTEKDGKRWLHCSLSRPHRLPDYQDMCIVKEVFLGSERKALQVFAPSSEHVNIHPHCLHLWSCIDGDGLPDFRIMGML